MKNVLHQGSSTTSQGVGLLPPLTAPLTPNLVLLTGTDYPSPLLAGSSHGVFKTRSLMEYWQSNVLVPYTGHDCTGLIGTSHLMYMKVHLAM